MTTGKPTIDELVVGDRPEAWSAAGFSVDDDGICRLGTVRVRLTGEQHGRHLRAWSLHGIHTATREIDGFPTTAAATDQHGPEPASHPNGTLAIDHVVLMSPDGDRTTAALAGIGLAALRTRRTGTYGPAMRQIFFRLGEVILELICPDGPPGEGPTRFFGLAHTVADLDATVASLDGHLGVAKAAVQPGRRIVTLRHKPLGISVATAFMSS
ncbi:hypothetical protein BH20ACT2_BH20ACT2_07900 [soil metagenome]